MDNQKVKEFYNKFLKSRMVNYRIYGSPRLERAKKRILPEIKSTSTVLDIGCGIGIVTEQLARKATRGKVWGIDLSRDNIWYSKKTIKESNLFFLECDIITEFDKVKNSIGVDVDVITMIDVIEHIPESSRQDLFNKVNKISSKEAKFILTYPSPDYQRYLMKNNPAELQIIDNIIEINTLIDEAHNAGFSLLYYGLQTIWRENDYVHVILQKSSGEDISGIAVEGGINVFRKIFLKAKNRFTVPFLKRKYITNVFN